MTADDAVVAAAKLGDPDAWRELYRAHAGRLVVWLGHRSPVDSAHAAEDLAAETWLTAASKLADFKGTSAEFGGWLFGIARKQAANARRTSGRRRTQPVDADVLGAHTPPLAGPETTVPGRQWVYDALAQLSPRERDVIACVEVVGMEPAEAARALGLSAVAVRVARHRGLKRLRAVLDPVPSADVDVRPA